MKKILFTVVIVFLAAGCLFPVTNDTRGLIRSRDDFTLVGINGTFDALNLKRHIPAEAGMYVEFGADSCFVAEFKRGNERYNVEIYSFLTPKGALGAYFITGLSGASEADLGYYARKNEKAVQFVKGNNIVLTSLLDGGTIEGAFELASSFDKRISSSRIVPDVYQPLPKTNIVDSSKLYFAGYRGFESRFSPELRKALQVQYALSGTAAKYNVGGRQVDLIKLRFSNRSDVLDGINSFLSTRKNRPIIHSIDSRGYNIIVEDDRSEVYIAEYGDTMYVMLGASADKKGQEYFEYVLRGGK